MLAPLTTCHINFFLHKGIVQNLILDDVIYGRKQWGWYGVGLMFEHQNRVQAFSSIDQVCSSESQAFRV